MCAAVDSALDDPGVEEALRKAARDQIDGHSDEIAKAISRHVRQAVVQQISKELGAFGPMLATAADAVVASAITPETTKQTLSALVESSDATRALSAIRPELSRLVREQCLPRIAGSLDIGGRISGAINKMDVEEFHQVVNEVAARHLGAIQVLGYILGAIAGAIMVALR